MFKIIWEDQNDERLSIVFRANNEKYLMQDEREFTLLGDLSTSSYDVFSSKDMEKLIKELGYLKKKVHDLQALEHIEEIINLATKCKNMNGSRLIFTPF